MKRFVIALFAVATAFQLPPEVTSGDAPLVWKIPPRHEYRPKVALALSGGGARGFAQISILQELEKAGITVDYIIGTSMGAIIGGLYATGYSPDELDSILSGASWDEMITLGGEQPRSDLFLDQKLENDRSLLTLRFNNFRFIVPEAVSAGARLTELLQHLVWNGLYHADGDFNRLKIPFRAVATDVVNGKSISLKSGNLVTAMQASATIPLRYTPVRIDSLVLVDGGIFANIPAEQAREFSPDVVIAVNTTSPLFRRDELDKPWNLADQVVSVLMQEPLTRQAAAADAIIQPDLAGITNEDYSLHREILARGRDAAVSALPSIIALLRRKEDSLLALRCPKGAAPEQLYASVSTVAPKIGSIQRTLTETVRLLHQSGENGALTVTQNGAFPTVSIVPSSYPIIGQVTVSLMPSVIPDTALADVFRHLVGRPASPETLRFAAEPALKILRNIGYAFSIAEAPEFDAVTRTLRLSLRIPPQGNIITNGLTGGISPRIIYREFDNDETLSVQSLLRGWENTLNSGHFTKVELAPRLNPETGATDLIINVREAGNQTARLGVRIDNERNAQGSLNLSHGNLLWDDTKLFARISGGSRNYTASIGAEANRIFDSFWSFSASGYFDSKNVYLYGNRSGLRRKEFERVRAGELTEERFGVRAILSKNIERQGKLFSEFRIEKQRFYTDSTEESSSFKPLGTVKIGARFDTEDRAVFPRSGRTLLLSAETNILTGHTVLGFSKIEAQFRSTFTVGRHSVAPSFHLGLADLTMPLTEFFSLGGEQQFIGMREDNERGRQIVAGSLEYRFFAPFTLFFDSYLSARYDFGTTWPSFEQVKFKSFKHGVGATLGLDTPIGPATLSFGRSFYFLDNPPTVAWGPVLAYFSIGMKM